MTNGLEALARMKYPGRFIIIGRSTSENDVIIYGITGRSPSSQARKLEFDEEQTKILVKPTDEETLKQGDPDLLVYPAIIFGLGGIAISNGKQTRDAAYHCNGTGIYSLLSIFSHNLECWEYEPDSPNFTPRISGIVGFDERYQEVRGALSAIKRAENGSTIKQYFEVPVIPGKGKLISTYTGENINPLPSFQGEPLDVTISAEDPKEVARQVYDSLNPQFRVAVVTVFDARDGHRRSSIINRIGEGK